MVGLASLFPWLQVGSDVGGPTGLGTPGFNGEQPSPEGDPIVVTAPQRPEFSQQEQEMLPSYRNSDILAELGLTQKKSEEASDRKGMFGIGGTFRDVLGFVGDTLLLNSGKNPMYHPRREQEKMSDAIAGFTENPMAAIERLANVNPEAAQLLYDKYNEAAYKSSQANSTRMNNESLAQDRIAGQLDTTGKFAANILNRVNANNKDYALDIIERRLPQGKTLKDIGLDRSMTPEQLQMYSNGNINRSQQENIGFSERRIGISQQNADSARMNAQRPRQGRSITPTEYLKSLIEIPASERTPEEQAYVEKNTQPSGKTSRRSGTVPPPPSVKGPIVINGRTFNPR